ncbi:MAG TPA: dihydropteroate synthase [Candidatus Eisenbacteria bacterium]|nr:dihydropteroate synthase [Candidatus Eisenbacteria bacterium]
MARAPLIFAHRFGRWDLTRTPRVVGILNVTPDSFSDGGRFVEPKDAARHAEHMIEEGADAIDIGGQSTRPGGGEPVGAEEEWTRIGPILTALRGRLGQAGEVPLSVDTYRAEVARRALAEGAAMINDVTGLAYEPGLANVAAEAGAGLVLMHSRGGPAAFHDPEVKEYDDIVGEVRWELYRAMRQALLRGVPEEAIVLDPGVGFSKRPVHSVGVLRGLPRLTDLGRPLYIGVSRKSFLGALTDETVDERLAAGLGATVAAYALGARIFRTHDVQATRDALTLAEALLSQSDVVETSVSFEEKRA